MRTSLRLLAVVLPASASLLGYPHIAFGQPQNLRVAEAICRRQGMAHKAKEGMRDTTDALIITPRVKSAIIGDSQLNNRHNHINVNTRDYVVHLVGHVYSSALKSRASLVATRKLNKMHKPYKVSNELTIVRK